MFLYNYLCELRWNNRLAILGYIKKLNYKYAYFISNQAVLQFICPICGWLGPEMMGLDLF